MPLFKSKKSASNDKSDSKPSADSKSLPIAMNVQRAAKKKKMAYGGRAQDDGNPGTPTPKPDDRRLPKEEYMSSQNEVRPSSSSSMISMAPRPSIDSEQDGMSLAERIRYKRKMAEGGMVDSDQMGVDALKKEMYADGGMVDLDEESEESPNQYYRQNREAANQEQYDDDQLSAQPRDSNEHGRDIEADAHDMVEMIRRKLMSKRQD